MTMLPMSLRKEMEAARRTVPTSAQSIAADYRRNVRIGLELAALVVVCVVWAVL